MKRRTQKTATKRRPKTLASRRSYGKAERGGRVAEPRPATKPRALVPKPWTDPLPPAERIARNRRAAALLREWMEEDSNYDEKVGAALDAMGECRVRFREDVD